MSTTDVRRELGTAVVGCLVGAAAVLLAGRITWASVRLVVGESIPAVEVEISGREAAPLAIALGLLGLAAAAGLIATRGQIRRLVGVVLLLSGVVVVVDATRAAGRFGALATFTSPGATADVISATGGSWLAVAGGILLAGSGLLTALRGARWTAMSQRYDAPGATPAAARPGSTMASQDPDVAWKALDRGEDPTA